MSLFQGDAPSPVELKSSTDQSAPAYLTNYLTNLASVGTNLLGTPSGTGADATFAPKTAADLITPLGTLSKAAYEGDVAQGVADPRKGLFGYSDTFSDAASKFKDIGISPSDISAFYNPYETDVINKLAEQQQTNINRNLLPSLRAGFAGQGALGSSRYANVLGQSLADVNQNLLAQQAKMKQAGYETALEAALKQAGLETQAGQGLTQLGRGEQEAAEEAYKALSGLGTQQMAYEQSKLEAPLTRAANVAQLLRGYSYPTSTSSKAETFPPMYNKSPLEQIAGLGSLIGAAYPSGGGGFGPKLESWITRAFNWLSEDRSGENPFNEDITYT